jgi:hypothetical protein
MKIQQMGWCSGQQSQYDKCLFLTKVHFSKPQFCFVFCHLLCILHRSLSETYIVSLSKIISQPIEHICLIICLGSQTQSLLLCPSM